jgi:hypothetical protein
MGRVRGCAADAADAARQPTGTGVGNAAGESSAAVNTNGLGHIGRHELGAMSPG